MKGFLGFLIAFTLDAEVVVAAVGSLDGAGNFHLTTLVLGGVYAPSKGFDFRGIQKRSCRRARCTG